MRRTKILFVPRIGFPRSPFSVLRSPFSVLRARARARARNRIEAIMTE